MTDYGCPICHRVTCVCGDRRRDKKQNRDDFVVRRSEWDGLAACIAQLKDALVVMNARAEGAEAEVKTLVAERDEALSRAACQLEASIRLKSEWEAERDALAARLAEAERALRHLIEWADDERGDAFGEREWADARAALAAADRPEGTTEADA